MKESLKKFGRSLLQPLVWICRVLHISPNALTIASLVVSVGAGYLFYRGMFVIAGILMACGGIFDTVDGELARSTQQTSRFGAFLDSNFDRVAEFCVLFGLFLFYYHTRTSILIVAALFASIMVSYTRARAEGVNVECRIGIFERPLRVFILTIGALFLNKRLFPVAIWILLAGTVVTVVERLVYVLAKLKKTP
jgi:CDP-diacylglycerol--glycerol-3-phosphate 3-phosphatidyltransferase